MREINWLEAIRREMWALRTQNRRSLLVVLGKQQKECLSSFIEEMKAEGMAMPVLPGQDATSVFGVPVYVVNEDNFCEVVST